MKKLLFLSATLFAFSGCEKEPGTPDIPFRSAPGSIYISNEGIFTNGNSTISWYNPETGDANINMYQRINMEPIGDVCQSLELINGKLYVVVNNSAKVIVCDPESLRKLSVIDSLTSPRYILPVGNDKAYISDLYSNQVTVVNLNNNTVISHIAINGWTEQMLLKNGHVYITNVYSDYLYVVDAITDQLSDSILISKGGSFIKEDINGKIWVLCGNDWQGTYDGALFRIDPASGNIETHINFPTGVEPSRLCINPAKDSLYFLNNGVWKISVDAVSLPSSPFIAQGNSTFYGLGVDSSRNEVYVSDAIDFVQRGKVIRYGADGTLISKIDAGIVPGNFLFLP